MTPTLQRLATAGRMFYGIAIVAFGLLHIGYADFVTRVAPWWPAWIPGRPFWAYLVGALLIAAGGAILLNMRTAIVATLLAAGLLLSFVLLGVPLMAGDRLFGGAWTVAFKALALCGGALLIARKTGAVGTYFFAAFLVLCGIQHFIFIGFVATLVPAWIPGAYFWSYFAGVALIASGVGLLLPATRPLAGLLAGLMIFSWVFLVHIPRAAGTFPQTTNEMVAVFEALAMSGIAWLAARSST